METPIWTEPFFSQHWAQFWGIQVSLGPPAGSSLEIFQQESLPDLGKSDVENPGGNP